MLDLPLSRKVNTSSGFAGARHATSKGGRGILRYMKKELDLEEGQTSPDYQFTLETVACLGACFLAPTMMVSRTYFGKLSPTKVSSIVSEYKKDKGGQ